MRKFRINILPVILLIGFLACSEEEEVFVNQPFTSIQLFNMDSLVSTTSMLDDVTDSLLRLDTSLQILDVKLLSISFDIDSLNILIEEGRDDLNDKVDSLNLVFDECSALQDDLKKNDSIYTAISADLTAIITDIESGNILISRIENSIDGRALTFEDSMTVYELPLSMNQDSSAYTLFVNEFEFNLILGYERVQALGVKDRIKIRTEHIFIKGHTFDSTEIECRSTACKDNETLVKLYF